MYRIKIEEIDGTGKVINTFPAAAKDGVSEVDGFFIIMEKGDRVMQGGADLSMGALRTALGTNPEISGIVKAAAYDIGVEEALGKGGSGHAPS